MPLTRPMPTADTADTAGTAGTAGRPRLAPHVRLTYDQARQRHVLLTPETVTLLNGTGAAILELCDGERTLAGIVARLGDRYGHVPGHEVRAFLTEMVARGCVEVRRG